MSLEEALAALKRDLPGRWWQVGSCCVSDDARIAPDFNDPIHGPRLKAELFPIEPGSELDAGFDIDQRPPGDVGGALMRAIGEAKAYLAAHKVNGGRR